MKWGNGKPIRGKLIRKSHAYGIFFTENPAAGDVAAKIEAKHQCSLILGLVSGNTTQIQKRIDRDATE